jgi:hypothetical protein
MIEQFWAVAKRLLGTRIPGGPVIAPQPASPNSQSATPLPAAVTGGTRRGRPMSAALLRTVECLTVRPDVTAAELAPSLGVSVSYARTLLRRARERSSSDPSPVLAPPPVAGSGPNCMDEIVHRLVSAEREIDELRSRRAGPKGRWDISCRAEVIRRGLAGETPGQIAAALGIPGGQVRFILKIQRLLMNAS